MQLILMELLNQVAGALLPAGTAMGMVALASMSISPLAPLLNSQQTVRQMLGNRDGTILIFGMGVGITCITMTLLYLATCSISIGAMTKFLMSTFIGTGVKRSFGRASPRSTTAENDQQDMSSEDHEANISDNANATEAIFGPNEIVDALSEQLISSPKQKKTPSLKDRLIAGVSKYVRPTTLISIIGSSLTFIRMHPAVSFTTGVVLATTFAHRMGYLTPIKTTLTKRCSTIVTRAITYEERLCWAAKISDGRLDFSYDMVKAFFEHLINTYPKVTEFKGGSSMREILIINEELSQFINFLDCGEKWDIVNAALNRPLNHAKILTINEFKKLASINRVEQFSSISKDVVHLNSLAGFNRWTFNKDFMNTGRSIVLGYAKYMTGYYSFPADRSIPEPNEILAITYN